eukprot:5061878-Pleurochrysis_carterae.AAC.1
MLNRVLPVSLYRTRVATQIIFMDGTLLADSELTAVCWPTFASAFQNMRQQHPRDNGALRAWIG